jgi:vacuolar-type H+-ATPase subunit D/Vma8
MQELELLQQKLDALLKRFTALQAENERLEKGRQQLSGVIAEQQDKLTALENALKSRSVALSASDMTEDQRAHFKQHLEQLIGEIDKNIEML